MSQRKISKLLTERSDVTPKQVGSDDGAFKIDFMPSLQNMAMTTIVTNLWGNKHIQKEITDISPTILYEDMSKVLWKTVVKNVINKVYKIPIAKYLRSNIASTVPPIGKQIYNWIMYYEKYLFENSTQYLENSAASLINSIHWNIRRGRIDYAKTARNILSNPYTCLNDVQKYKLACDCCLEHEIFTIAPKVDLDSLSSYFYPMVYFWTERIRTGNVSVSYCKTILRNLFRNYYGFHNDVPLIQIWRVFKTYDWNTFSDAEKYDSIKYIVETLCDQELKWSLLSTLNYEQQREILKACSSNVLIGILKDWQMREYFLPLSLHVLDFIESDSYNKILETILIEKSKISPTENQYLYNEYKSFFKTLWVNCSNKLKNALFNTCYIRFIDDNILFDEILLNLLCWIRDRDIVELLFKDIYAQQRTYAPVRDTGVAYCCFLLLNEQWELLEQFIMFAFFPSKYLNYLIQHPFKEIETGAEEENSENLPEVLSKKYIYNKRNIEYLIQNHEFRKNPNYARWASIFRWLYRKTKADSEVLEGEFAWCFDEQLTKTRGFQCDFPEFAAWLLIIIKLVEEDKLELLYERVNMQYPTDNNCILTQDD